MNYIGTRGFVGEKSFAGALLDGLAPDGGLYVPASWPVDPTGFDLHCASNEPYHEFVQYLLGMFGVIESLGLDAAEEAAKRTERAFLRDGQVPLTQLDDSLWLLELWHGPTLAFKDMAMQMMAPLTDAALAQTNQTLTLVTATSGDTGAAAVRAFAGSQRVRLVVFHPLGRVSPVQRLQMTTVEAGNVLNVGVAGDFDDCQRMVKQLLGNAALKARGLISSVNSINWGRLLGQVPYYLAAAAASGARHPEFVVPTGNFGDAFAGWAGRRIGGNIGHLHAAVNRNDALAEAINDGHYIRRPAVETASVSMDVQAPSNFERLVFEASGRDAVTTKAFFDTYVQLGAADVSPDLQYALRAEVTASSIDETKTAEAIRHAWDAYGQVICPHTAVALAAALERRSAQKNSSPQIVLATAHPAKFPDFVAGALGFAPKVPEAIQALYGRKETIREIANDDDMALKTVSEFTA